VLIDRIVAIEWSICRLHARLVDGQQAQQGARELLAFHNHLRLITRELQNQPPPGAPHDDRSIKQRKAASLGFISDYNGLRERIATTLQREPRSELGDLNPASKGGNTRRALVRPIHCFVVRRWMEPGFPGSSIAQYNRLSQETRKN
jgi:hypothetical protein